MKTTKTIMYALVGLTLTFGVGIVLYSTMAEIKPVEYIIYAAIGLIVIFSFVRVFQNFKNEKKGLTTDDELSQKIKQKAAANSFMVSFYLWTMILLVTVDSNISNEVLIGIGVIGMGLIFVGFWIYYNNKGIDNGNQN